MRGKVYIIQGGQYGSEGKGQIAAFVAGQRKVEIAVRTGSINAGHTVYKDGRKFTMQIVPTPWIHPEIRLVLGAGCYIEPDILLDEIRQIKDATGEDIRHRLFIDRRCFMFGAEERNRAKDANRHHAMGATGKGASEGIITKMRARGEDEPELRLFSRSQYAGDFQFIETDLMLNRRLDAGADVLLEGTQGAHLDFNLGPYPYVTTRMTNASAWLAEAGLPPVNVHTILVLRSHPIRVAGNSGPLPDEINWPSLAEVVNELQRARGHGPVVPDRAIRAFRDALTSVAEEHFPDVVREIGARVLYPETLTPGERKRYRVFLSEANALALQRLDAQTLEDLRFFEKTTVTKKLRRVAMFNCDDALIAIKWNAPAEIAYTFLNYDMPDLTGETNLMTIQHTAGEHLADLERMLKVPIRYVTTEREQHHVIDLNS